jgi:hypothetical protein
MPKGEWGANKGEIIGQMKGFANWARDFGQFVAGPQKLR